MLHPSPAMASRLSPAALTTPHRSPRTVNQLSPVAPPHRNPAMVSRRLWARPRVWWWVDHRSPAMDSPPLWAGVALRYFAILTIILTIQHMLLLRPWFSRDMSRPPTMMTAAVPSSKQVPKKPAECSQIWNCSQNQDEGVSIEANQFVRLFIYLFFIKQN